MIQKQNKEESYSKSLIIPEEETDNEVIEYSSEDKSIINRNPEKKGTRKKASVKPQKDELLQKVLSNKQIVPKATNKPTKKTEYENFKEKSIILNKTELNENKISKDEIMEKCRKIFYNFAKFSPEEKDFFLSQQSLIKILTAVGFFKEKLIKLPEIDIILKRINNNSTRLTKKDFVNFLVKIASRVDPKTYKINSKDAVSNLMRNYFEPFANYIEEKTLNGEDDPIFPINNIFYHGMIENKVTSFEMEDEDICLLQSVNTATGLKEIYNSYFPVEKFKNIDKDKIYTLCLNNFLEFAKDYEILPLQCGINQLVVYFTNIVNIKNENITNNKKSPVIFEEKVIHETMFSLNKFTLLLVHLAIMIFNKNNYKDINENFKNYEKVLLFFEKLEHSKGFENLQYKTYKFNSSIRLMPKKDFNVNKEEKHNSSMQTIKLEIENDKDNGCSTLVPKQIKLLNEKLILHEKVILSDFMSASNDVINKLNSQLENYLNIFESYCIYGDKACFRKMNLTGYMKFLKDFHLILDIPKEKLYSDINRSQSMSKMNMSSSKLFMSSDDYLRNDSKLLIKKIKINLDPENDNINKAAHKIKESDVGIIFNEITGYKNFNSSNRTKGSFDKNSGYALHFEDGFRGLKFDKFNTQQSTKTNIPFRMDFNLFLKSFEIIANKLYPNMNTDDALTTFLEFVILFTYYLYIRI